ncbi:hypothetical protein AWC00_13575 [Mycobacterium conspicuum]|nr:hypothetical protein AWC00_13575 [Mycobacterium conspicuum]
MQFNKSSMAAPPTRNNSVMVHEDPDTPRPKVKLWLFVGVLFVIACLAIPAIGWTALRANNRQHRDPASIAAEERRFALPFTDLRLPHGVAVDAAGGVYVTDTHTNRVLKLAAGSTSPTVLPFANLDLGAGVVDNSTGGVAVDSAGNVYVVDTGHAQVLELAAGSSAQNVLPFRGLSFPKGLAVDGAGAVYVAEGSADRVVKLAHGAQDQTVLPPLGRGVLPSDVAVDTSGDVYVSVGKSCGRRTCSYLMRLAPGSNSWTQLESAGVEQYVAVDTAGAVYVITSGDTGRVMRRAPGSSDWTELPGAPALNDPQGLAVDTHGDVYVTDHTGYRSPAKLFGKWAITDDDSDGLVIKLHS